MTGLLARKACTCRACSPRLGREQDCRKKVSTPQLTAEQLGGRTGPLKEEESLKKGACPGCLQRRLAESSGRACGMAGRTLLLAGLGLLCLVACASAQAGNRQPQPSDELALRLFSNSLENFPVRPCLAGQGLYDPGSGPGGGPYGNGLSGHRGTWLLLDLPGDLHGTGGPAWPWLATCSPVLVSARMLQPHGGFMALL